MSKQDEVKVNVEERVLGGRADLERLLEEEKARYSIRQTFRSFFSRASILLMLLVTALLIVSLFFERVYEIRVTVETALLALLLLANMWVFYIQDKHLYLSGVSRIEHRLKELTGTGVDMTFTQTCMDIVYTIINKFRNPPVTPIHRFRKFIRRASLVLAVASLLASIIAVTVRIAVFPNLRDSWASLYLQRNAYLLLPILPWSLRLLMHFAHALQTAKLHTLYQLVCSEHASNQNARQEELLSPPDADMGKETTPEEYFQLIVDRKLPQKLLVRYLWKLLSYKDPSLPPTTLFDIMGDATRLCTFDKRLLTDDKPFVQRVMVFCEDSATVLTLSKHPQDGIEFDQAKMLNDCLPSMKPLGLNCMLSLEEEGQSVMEEALRELGKVIGFKESIAESFSTLSYIVYRKEDDPSAVMYSGIVKELSGGLQYFSRGSVSLVLRHCKDYWDGTGIKPLTKELKKKILDISKAWVDSDCEPVAFAYKNIPPKQSKYFTKKNKGRNESSDKILDKLKDGQILIGMVGLRSAVRNGAKQLISQLDKSYIRFVLLSNDGEQQTKVFGGQLGLETDWNSIICLRDPQVPPSPPNGIQKLPVGISSIPDHIDNVDNVPLLVRLFCDTDSESKYRIIKIFQQYGETVLGVAPDSNAEDYKAMGSADLMVGISEQLAPKESRNLDLDDVSVHESSKNWSQLQRKTFARTLVGNLTQLLCAFTLPPSFFEAFLQLVKFSRYLLNNTMQFTWFVFATTLALHIHQLFTSVFFVPPTLTGVHLLWITFIVIPLIGMSLLASSIPPNLLSLISDKNLPIRANKVARITFYLILRTIPSVVVTLVVFMIALMSAWSQAPSVSTVMGFAEPTDSEVFKSEEYRVALNFAQNVDMFAIVLYIVVASISSHHRTLSIFSFNPFRNWRWIIACLGCLVLQVIFFVISVKENLELLSSLPWYLFVILFCWPILQIAIEELIKRHDKSIFKTKQDILKLEFETKLGMHSPI